MNVKPSRLRLALVLFTFAGLAASPAMAEPEKKADPLAGPNVTDKVAPGSHGSFGANDKDKGDKKRAEQEIPHPVFMRAVNEGIGENAPENVRATKELMDKISGVSDELGRQQRKFVQENRELINKLGGRAKVLEKGKGPGKGKGGDAAPSGEGQDAMQSEMDDKMRELRDRAPKPADAHTKIWAMLSEAQQEAVQAKLDVHLKEMRDKANERYIEQRAGKKAPQAKPGEEKPEVPGADQPKKPGKRPGAGAPGEAGGSTVSPEHRERVMKLLERLTPEQREEVIRRIEERLANGEGARPQGRPGRPGQGGGESKPAPKGTDVNVPVPEAPAKKDGGN